MNFQLIYKFYYGSYFHEGEFKPSILSQFNIRTPDDLKEMESLVGGFDARNAAVKVNHHFFQKEKFVTIRKNQESANTPKKFKISDIWVENRFDNENGELLAEMITHVFLG